MPGPVSEAYDHEFGVRDNARRIEAALAEQLGIVTNLLGPDVKDILDVVNGPRGKAFPLSLCERQLRVIRFALDRALETL